MNKFGMELEREEYFTGYNMNINPGVANAIGTTALYFFISLMPRALNVFDKVLVVYYRLIQGQSMKQDH